MKRAKTLQEFLSDPETTCPRPITIRRAVEQVLALFGPTGGASFSLFFGDLTGQPFFAVSLYPERTRLALDLDSVAAVLAQFIADNRDLLEDPRNCVGLWHDVDADVVFIDVSTLVAEQALAVELGKTYNQIEIYDLLAGRSIPTGGTGEKRKGWPAEKDRLGPLSRG